MVAAAAPAADCGHLEFFAAINLLCALSTCPGAVCLSGGPTRDPIDVCRPLGVEVCALDPILHEGWKSQGSPPYKSAHGMRLKKNN